MAESLPRRRFAHTRGGCYVMCHDGRTCVYSRIACSITIMCLLHYEVAEDAMKTYELLKGGNGGIGGLRHPLDKINGHDFIFIPALPRVRFCIKKSDGALSALGRMWARRQLDVCVRLHRVWARLIVVLVPH